MPAKRPPKDVNELATHPLDASTGEAEGIEPKNPTAVELRCRGDLKSGQSRARQRSPTKRKAIAKKAAKARWEV
ncbi:MAG TPA: hypothetical protein VI750_10790 [Pyrinomonadaceae bacterium]|nr:hypothetical protein [Pyrinomonadaceae bacterium]